MMAGSDFCNSFVQEFSKAPLDSYEYPNRNILVEVMYSINSMVTDRREAENSMSYSIEIWKSMITCLSAYVFVAVIQILFY